MTKLTNRMESSATYFVSNASASSKFETRQRGGHFAVLVRVTNTRLQFQVRILRVCQRLEAILPCSAYHLNEVSKQLSMSSHASLVGQSFSIA